MTPAGLLKKYNEKRDFRRTPEPAGQTAQSTPRPIFVIQKHAASHLHYDFRLEVDGVLKSWAVPKGPATDPHVKRLAVQVEDHPLNYAGFEGVIPAGQYGGGRVIVWDTGTYENITYHNGRPVSMNEGLQKGHITIRLEGKKLRGGYALTRIASRGNKPQWLLIKSQDDQANQPEDPVQSLPQSVLSGRTVDTVGQGKSVRYWASNREPMPEWVSPMLATLVDKPFERPGWIYEPKLDGERCLAYRKGNDIQLFTRNRKSITQTYPEIVRALKTLKADSYVLDGEIVAFEPGTEMTSFKRLQQRMHLHHPRDVEKSTIRVFYYLFDILYQDGRDLRPLPLVERKAILKTMTLISPLRINPYLEKGAEEYYKEACRKHWEGVIAKRAEGPYVGGRSRDWVKFKCINEQEFVIGGYTDPQGARDAFGALLIGYYDGDQLQFAGKVGTGFDSTTLGLLRQKMKPLERKTSPFAAIDLPLRGLHWVEPKLVVQIGFGEWTEEGKLRQPRFIGLRDDKAPTEVTRETKLSENAITVTRSPQRSSQLTIGNKVLTLSNLSKVFYPSTQFTKGQMLDYYIKVAPLLLPHLRGRPLTLKRYPNGVEDQFFYEKQAPSYRPSWLHTYVMGDEKSGKKTEYCVVDDLASLIWIANLATLELHALLARAPHVDLPTLVAFDMDPGAPAGLLKAMKVALRLRDLLQKLGLKSFPKTSGGKGLHVYIPLNTKTTYSQTQDFAHAAAMLLERQQPNEVVSNMRKELRKGKVLVDWSQNTRHKTTVSVYSLRAQSQPTVSTPVTWEEVERAVSEKDPAKLRFTADQVLKRVSQKGDLFAAVQTLRQKLPRLGLESNSNRHSSVRPSRRRHG